MRVRATGTATKNYVASHTDETAANKTDLVRIPIYTILLNLDTTEFIYLWQLTNSMMVFH